VYFCGPGCGESQVVALPDGRWLVVDACRTGKESFPLRVLRRLGATEVHLAIVTHPDLDHIAGFAELAAGVTIHRLWRYAGGTLRDVLSSWVRKIPGQARLQELSKALDAMDRLADANRCVEAGLDTRDWPDEDGAPYRVTCIAPCAADVVANRRTLQRLVELSISKSGEAKPRLSKGVEQLMLGRSRHLNGRGNPLSLAVVLWWGEIGILLSGDVECSGDRYRGWDGICAALQDDGRLQLLRGPKLVKVAHHGSNGAFSQLALGHPYRLWQKARAHCSAHAVRSGSQAAASPWSNEKAEHLH